MKILQTLQGKSLKRVIGLMSGTSVDGIDAALLELQGHGTRTVVRVKAFDTYAFPRGLRERILENSLPGGGSVDELCRLNVLLAHLYADAARRIARKGRVAMARVDLIGSHGQTMHHLPHAIRMYGISVRSTLQIGDPATISHLTGIPTVGNFRTANMAAGGQGAPLVPYVDYLLYRSSSKSRLLLSLGGIANFTYLPANCGPAEVVAFDTGPANMVLDALMMKLYRRRYDRGGKTSMEGSVIPSLLRWMLRHPYLSQKPPKSTGREVFGERFVAEMLRRARRAEKKDLLATASAFTALSVYDQFVRFVRRDGRVDEMFVSGGGVHNHAVLGRLE
ncbi:MAG: anhydro-N-acetylmuramic acid kinase, partial [Proteobacteria bacterium]|nr:anhydro-N-acetylmuramic acid kinase [Pseudomonadota bacterium]